MTAFCWHGHELNPTGFVSGTVSSGQNLQFRYPDFNDVGVTINRPVYFSSEYSRTCRWC
jgi:hypothetical protein